VLLFFFVLHACIFVSLYDCIQLYRICQQGIERNNCWRDFSGQIFQGEFFKADASGRDLLCWQRGQGNFELAANSGYDSRGSADPRESLRKRRISKLPLSAHKVLPAEQIPA